MCSLSIIKDPPMLLIYIEFLLILWDFKKIKIFDNSFQNKKHLNENLPNIEVKTRNLNDTIDRIVIKIIDKKSIFALLDLVRFWPVMTSFLWLQMWTWLCTVLGKKLCEGLDSISRYILAISSHIFAQN